MRVPMVVGAGFLSWLLTSPCAFGQVQFQVERGRVTIVAQDVTIAQILSEWSRVGGTTFVNAEKLGDRVTLELRQVPEGAALDLLLRSASGYVIAARSPVGTGGSAYRRVWVVPTSTPPPPLAAADRRPVSVPGATSRLAPAGDGVVQADGPQGLQLVGGDDTPQPLGVGQALAGGSPEEPATAHAADQAAGVVNFTAAVPVGGSLLRPRPIPERFQGYPSAGAPSGVIGGPAGTAVPGQVTEVPGPPGRSEYERLASPGSGPAPSSQPTSTSQPQSQNRN